MHRTLLWESIRAFIVPCYGSLCEPSSYLAMGVYTGLDQTMLWESMRALIRPCYGSLCGPWSYHAMGVYESLDQTLLWESMRALIIPCYGSLCEPWSYLAMGVYASLDCTMLWEAMRTLIVPCYESLCGHWSYLAMRVYASFDLAVQNQLHEFILQGEHRRVEGGSHFTHVRWQVRAEVLQHMVWERYKVQQFLTTWIRKVLHWSELQNVFNTGYLTNSKPTLNI